MTSIAPVPVAAPAPAPPSAILGTYKRAPMLFVRGEGVYLFDEAGRAYLDFTSGIAVNALGYGDAQLNAVIQDALGSGLIHTSNLFRTAPGEALAESLVSRSGFAHRAFFCNSGAEANEGAFKIARKWGRALGGPAKHEIIAVRGSFHGRLFATVAATDRPAYRLPFRPLVPGVHIVERDLGELETALDPETTCALIVEPIQGEGGVRVLEPALLQAMRRMTQERQIAFILDEIQCGLGRTGHLFAYERAEIQPDLVTLAKPMAGGLPMGAVLMSQPFAEAMAPGDHGTTFGGGPFVASVALHVLTRLADPALLAHVRAVGQVVGDELAAMQARTGRIRAVRGTGLMWGVDVHEPAAAVIERARGLGLLVVSAGEHTLRLLPPLVLTRDEALIGLARLEQAITAG
ncbi:MAG: acetylornithine transaminase [Gemmatimonadaceae bacterium]|jgi:predicted acetylornithine/succinylornithine family transaminase|nr:acetylornithine transaminase [Gemmatimonadaceae bacterium]